MNNYFIAIVFFLFVCSSSFAQGGRVVSTSSDEPIGLRIDVADKENFIPDAQILLVMGKDTLHLKTDRRGRVYYSGPFRTEKFTLIVSYCGYKTQQREVLSPAPHLADVSRFGQYFTLIREEEPDSGSAG